MFHAEDHSVDFQVKTETARSSQPVTLGERKRVNVSGQ